MSMKSNSPVHAFLFWCTFTLAVMFTIAIFIIDMIRNRAEPAVEEDRQ